MNISKIIYENDRKRKSLEDMITALSSNNRYEFKKKTYFSMEEDDLSIYFASYYGNISDCFKTFIFDTKTNMGIFSLKRDISIEDHHRAICIKELDIESMCFTKTYLNNFIVYAEGWKLKKDTEYNFMCIEIDYR